jgi:uncharacterized protein (TIGR03067 family)
MRFYLSAALACLALAFISNTQAEEAKKDIVQGTWEITDGTVSGKPAPAEMRQGIKFKFDGEKLLLSVPGSTQECTFKLDAAKKPKALDITALDGPNKGKTLLAIYELKGEELKLCLPNHDNQDRPTEFKSPEGSSLAVFVLKRAK